MHVSYLQPTRKGSTNMATNRNPSLLTLMRELSPSMPGRSKAKDHGLDYVHHSPHVLWFLCLYVHEHLGNSISVLWELDECKGDLWGFV